MTRDDAWSEVSVCCEQMSRDEMRVMARIARRIVTGRSVYGPLCLAQDKRSWAEERRQELYDAVVYDACDGLARDTMPAPHSVTGDGRDVVIPDDAECPPFNPYGEPYVRDTADLIPDASPTLPSTAPEGLYREVGRCAASYCGTTRAKHGPLQSRPCALRSPCRMRGHTARAT